MVLSPSSPVSCIPNLRRCPWSVWASASRIALIQSSAPFFSVYLAISSTVTPPPLLVVKTSNAQGNQSSDPGSNEEMRQNSKSTTLEESGTQAPVAVEPVNTGTLGKSTREEEDEVTIRRAFEIIDDHERNLVRRLENVRR